MYRSLRSDSVLTLEKVYLLVSLLVIPIPIVSKG
jgi:hypothetical protein